MKRFSTVVTMVLVLVTLLSFCVFACAEETVNLTLSLALQPELREQLRGKLREHFNSNGTMCIAEHVMEAAEKYRQLRKTAGARDRIDKPEPGHPSCEEGGCTMDQNRQETIKNLARFIMF